MESVKEVWLDDGWTYVWTEDNKIFKSKDGVNWTFVDNKKEFDSLCLKNKMEVDN